MSQCGACWSYIGTTVGCPSCEPVARVWREHEAKCYAYMLFGGEKPNLYDRWLIRRKRKR